MKKDFKFGRKALQMLLFIVAYVLQIIWLIGLYNYGDLLIGSSFSMDDINFILTSSAFFIEFGLLCVANILMLMAFRNLQKGELFALIFLVLIEFGMVCLFAVLWFSRVWIKHPPTSFGLGYVISIVFILSIPILMHIWIILRNRWLLTRTGRFSSVDKKN